MGCLYCGGPIPPKPLGQKGRERQYCSDACRNRYGALKFDRKRRGLTIEHCKNCEKVLLREEKDYCSAECRGRREHPEYQIAGINMLRMAIIKQARQDRVMDWWPHTKQFFELFPEIAPEQVKGVRNK